MNAISGQAMVEYLVVFGFLALLAVNLVSGLGEFFKNTVGSLGMILTHQLNVGHCEDLCFFFGYGN